MYLEYFETTPENCRRDGPSGKEVCTDAAAVNQSQMDPDRAQELVEFAHIETPRRQLKIPPRDEPAKGKMCESVLTRRCQTIDDEAILNLVDFASP